MLFKNLIAWMVVSFTAGGLVILLVVNEGVCFALASIVGGLLLTFIIFVTLEWAFD